MAYCYADDIDDRDPPVAEEDTCACYACGWMGRESDLVNMECPDCGQPMGPAH